MVDIRRITFTRKRIESLKKKLRSIQGRKKSTNTDDEKVRERDPVLPEWAHNTSMRGARLFINGKQVVAIEDVENFLRDRIYDRTKPPISMSRDGGFDTLQKAYIGIGRRAWYSWLSKQETFQQQAARPKVYSKPGQRLYHRGHLAMDLVEIKEKDLAHLGRTRPTYLFTLVDRLTGYLTVLETKTKTSLACSRVLDKMLGQMETALGTKVKTIQSDDGGEFKSHVLALLKKRGIAKKVVPISARIEQANAFLQAKLYELFKQRRGGRLGKYLEEARGLVNNTKSRISGFSPADALAQKDADLAKKFNSKRQAPGKQLNTKITAGDKVRVLIKGRKQETFFKSYRGQHYGPVQTVSKVKGTGFVVAGKTYPRDRLYKVPGIDKKSKALLESRAKPTRVVKTGPVPKKAPRVTRITAVTTSNIIPGGRRTRSSRNTRPVHK